MQATVIKTDSDSESTFYSVGTTHIRVVDLTRNKVAVYLWCQAQGWRPIATWDHNHTHPASVAPSRRDEAQTELDDFHTSCAARAHKILFGRN